MRHLKLMPDYDCFPLWDCDRIDNLDPEDLPISNLLKHQLMEWATNYDATLNRQDPLASGFTTPQALEHFEAKGLELWQQLQLELGQDYQVQYFSTIQNHLL